MYSVLIVDDEQNIRNGLSILIDWGKLGFSEVITAEDGAEALIKLNENKIHLVITDIRMPGMNGLELIHKMRELKSCAKIIILSGYNEFSYAKEAIRCGVVDYILKPVAKDELEALVIHLKQEIDEELKHIIITSKKNNLLRDKLLWNVSNGKYKTAQEAIISSSYELDLAAEYYSIFIIYIENTNDLFKVNQEEAKLIHFLVRNIVEEYLQPCNAFVYEEDDMKLGIISLSDEPYKITNDIVNNIMKAQCYIKELYKQDIIVACGNLVTNFHDIQHSKAQALYALGKKHLFNKGQILLYRNAVLENEMNATIEWDVSPLFAAVEEMDIDDIEKQAKILIKELIEKKADKNTIDGMITFFLFEIKKLLVKYSGDYNVISKDIIISNIEDFTLLEDWIIETSINTGRYLSLLSKQAFGNNMDEIKKYIDEHFSEEMSLKTIASKFYMNPAYLGRIFKKSIHMSFNDYLNSRRISEVKKLYANSKLKINEILDKTGYNSPDYFYRVFKKQEGITFSEYCNKVKSTMDIDS